MVYFFLGGRRFDGLACALVPSSTAAPPRPLPPKSSIAQDSRRLGENTLRIETCPSSHEHMSLFLRLDSPTAPYHLFLENGTRRLKPRPPPLSSPKSTSILFPTPKPRFIQSSKFSTRPFVRVPRNMPWAVLQLPPVVRTTKID
jgi:hypothetical protein